MTCGKIIKILLQPSVHMIDYHAAIGDKTPAPPPAYAPEQNSGILMSIRHETAAKCRMSK